MPASLEQLQNEYYALAPLAERFNIALRNELEELLKVNKISLGVPIEYRVKKLDSIVEKIDRKTISLENITDLPDLIGLRLILLFSRDVAKTCELISTTFTVLQKEDAQERLSDTQFGYQSYHYLIQLPEDWLSVPSFASVGQFRAEIQIRTVAQHIWAAASHVLQYKQESSVPLPVRRSIHRVSAILETVDLEFERVLEARESYISTIGSDERMEPLNVDSIARVLDSWLPTANKVEEEPYADLLAELLDFGIDSTEKLKEVLQLHLKKALKDDARVAKEMSTRLESLTPLQASRTAEGVFFTHVGLVRLVLGKAFGEEYHEYQRRRLNLPKTKTARKAKVKRSSSQHRVPGKKR